MAKRLSKPRRTPRLGQHFLTSRGALDAIVAAADPVADDIILEIGPGKGALTERLLTYATKVIAVEKDTRLTGALRERFATEIQAGHLELVEGDIRDFDPEILYSYAHPYKVVANIPYYLTGFIIGQFLTAPYQPERMVLLVQKEVAERVLARDGKESLLSLSVKAYGSPRIEAIVKRGSFAPPPAVDSAILSIKTVSRARFTDARFEARFFALVRAGFAHKRKRLAGNLRAAGCEAEATQVGENARAEDVPLERWLALVESS